MHRRRWKLDPHGLTVEDELTGRFKSAEARYHLPLDHGLNWEAEGGSGTQVRGTWHPRFGESEPCDVLSVRPEGSSWVTRFLWT